MGGHVFISYSRHDRAYVIALAERLLASGVEVWLDRDIESGERWIPVVRRKVATCTVFLLVMSGRAEASRVVQDEIALAIRTQRDIHTFLLDGEPMFPVSAVQYVDVRDRQMPDEPTVAKLRQLAPRVATAEVGPADRLGPVGSAELASILGGGHEFFDQQALLRLRSSLLASGESLANVRAVAVLDDLLFAVDTRLFLRTHLPEALSTRLLRQAAVRTIRTGLPADLTSDADYVEKVALSYPAGDANCRASMTTFVLTLAMLAGRAASDPAIQQWVLAAGTAVLANDLVTRFAQRQRATRLRLVVSLGDSLTPTWPDSVRAWLLEDNAHRGHADFPSERSQSGAERAICEAIDWGEEQAEGLDLPLRRLEIAVPAGLLLQWRPERVAHGPMLGVDYDVVVRWSERIKPRQGLSWINSHAKGRLQSMCGADAIPVVHWLRSNDIVDSAALRTHLQNGRYAGPVAMAERRSVDGRIVDLLLQFSPILMWPDPADEFPSEHHPTVAEHWEALPDALVEAYRAGWRGETAGPLAELRAVWDDEEWLRFCASVRVGR